MLGVPMPDRNAVSPTREEDFPEWYQQVIRAADLAENSEVRGCMVIKPWGYALWERHAAQSWTGCSRQPDIENAYFPLFIPLSYLEKEAEHVEGFAKECAVVTHHRLETKPDGKLRPAPRALSEPLVVRPTSETIIGAAYARWVKSYRDLPILHQSMGECRALGAASTAFPAHHRVSLAGGAYRARNRSGGQRGDAEDVARL